MKKKLLVLILTLGILASCLVPATSVRTDAAANEYKGVWFAFYDYESYRKTYKNNTAANFTLFFDKVLDNCKARGFNTILVHVRAFGDAFYKSAYFPTSASIAGKQGRALTYDPLQIMVTEAHKKGMRIEAWINPYRVSGGSSYKALSSKNQAKKWHKSKKASTRRNVLSYGGKLYYNPAKKAVRKLIINGVKEIVTNYSVDGIHMDDYFYPSFTKRNYKSAFDAKEYKASLDKRNGMSIENYRRKQVNLLVSGIYSAIKAINRNVTFGISPAGEIDNLTSKYSYYVDIKTWTNSTGYVDYIAPQIYWGFYHRTAKYNNVLNRWKNMTDQSKVKLYVGLPVYKMGYPSAGTTSKEKAEFRAADTLSKMITYGRSHSVNGFVAFDYADIVRPSAQKFVNSMAVTFNQ